MINAIFDGAYSSVTSQAAFLHDYGQSLRVFGIALPAVVEAHFSAEESGKSTLRTGTYSDGVAVIPIPDSLLEEVGSFYCYIFDRESGSGRTVYKIKVPVLKRADMPTETTEPSEQDAGYFEQVLSQMTELAERTETAADEATGAKDALLEGLSIGEVETLGADQSASASFTESDGRLLLNLGIPAGVPGEKGETGSGGVGESTTGTVVTYEGTEYTCEEGAERFNDYEKNIAAGIHAHAEGTDTRAIGKASHAEGGGSQAVGEYSHAEGTGTRATGDHGAHAEGGGTQALGYGSHAEGGGTRAQGHYAHAEGGGSQADGSTSHAEGGGTKATGTYAHSEGYTTKASGENSHAEGAETTAAGETAHSEGYKATANGVRSHAEGDSTSTGTYAQGAHAEGIESVATGRASHAEGQSTSADGHGAHAEGGQTKADGTASHAEGMQATASGEAAHAEGYSCTASSWGSHAEGIGTITWTKDGQHVQGMYNKEDLNGRYLHIVGNGSGTGARSNAHTIDEAGVSWYASDVRCGGTDQNDENSVSLTALAAKIEALEAKIAALEGGNNG